MEEELANDIKKAETEIKDTKQLLADGSLRKIDIIVAWFMVLARDVSLVFIAMALILITFNRCS